MKKSLAYLLACVIAVLSLSCAFLAFAEDAVSIAVGAASGKAGETVEVPVKLDKNSGLAAIDIRFKYDTSALELTGGKNGDVRMALKFPKFFNHRLAGLWFGRSASTR